MQTAAYIITIISIEDSSVEDLIKVCRFTDAGLGIKIIICDKKKLENSYDFSFCTFYLSSHLVDCYRSQPCQCNLATCYLIDGCSEEIDKPFKRVVT